MTVLPELYEPTPNRKLLGGDVRETMNDMLSGAHLERKLPDYLPAALPEALADVLPASLAEAGVSADPRGAIPLLFNAGATGKAITSVPAGAYVLRTQIFSGGLWAGAGARLKITGASGAITYADAVTQNTDQAIALGEQSTLQMMVSGNPWGLYATLAPPSRPDLLDPPIYFRAIEDAGITATSFSDPIARKEVVGPFDFYMDKVDKPYAIQRAYNRLTGLFTSLTQFATAPGDVPGTHGENDRAERKAEYDKDTGDYHNSAPFNTPIAWTHDLLFPPGPKKIGSFGVNEQWHATEDNSATRPGVVDNFLSPVFALETLGAQDGSGDEILRISTRGSADPLQGSANYTPTVHYERRNNFRGKWLRFYYETSFSYTGTGYLRVWLSENGGTSWTQIVNATGLTNAYNDVKGPHYASGQYSSGEGTPFFQYVAETTPQIVQQDNFNMVVNGDMRSWLTNPKPLTLPAEVQF